MALSSEFTPSSHDDQLCQSANCEELIYQLAQLMRTRVKFEEFEEVLLQSAVHGLNAAGGALWNRNPAGDLDCIVEQSTNAQPFSPQLSDEWRTLRQSVIESGQPRVTRFTVEPEGDSADDSISGLNRLAMLQPLAAESRAVLLEVHQPKSFTEEGLNEARTFLGMLSELHAEYLKHQKLEALEVQSRHWKDFESFARKLQSCWDPQDVYAHIVDGGRELCGFDRLTLLTGVGKRCRVRAVSCTDHVSRHSQTVQKLQVLCGLLTTVNQEVQFDGESEQSLAPELQSRLQDLLHVTDARILQAVPLQVSRSGADLDETCVAGVLVGENFRSGLDSDAYARLRGIAGQAAPAVERAALWENLPANWFLRGWIALVGSPIQRTKSAWRWVLLAAVLLVSVLAWVPADFRVKSSGALQPVDLHHVFAPMDATVKEIHFLEDQTIRLDQPLLSLADPDLELKLEEVRGEQARVQTRMRTIQTLRSNVIRSSSNVSEDDELAAEANELRKRQESLEAQLKILQRKEEQLSVLSPIAGEVLTWNSQELLRSRPVVAGQLLLTIADVEGSWKIDMKIPEHEIGHVRQALSENAGELPIEFSLDSQVGESFEAILREEQIARRAEIDPDFQHVFRAVVSLTGHPGFEPFSGAEVGVRIHCGTRTLGFVLFHDFYEWFQKNIFF